MIKCERCTNNPQRCNTRQQQTFFNTKEYSENLRSKKIEKLIVGQSDEIYGVNPLNCEDSSWKHLSFVGDEEIISLSHAKVYVFSDSVLCLGMMNKNPQSNYAWEEMLMWFIVHQNTELWTQLMVSQWNSSGISSQDSPQCSSATYFQEFLSNMSEKLE